MEFIIDNANDFDYDEENISFVVQELTAAAHQIHDVSPRCTVYILKTLLGSMRTGNLRENQMRVICNSIVIEDGRVISSYGITNGTIIHLVPRLRGGARTRRTTYAIPHLMTDTSSDEDSDEDSD